MKAEQLAELERLSAAGALDLFYGDESRVPFVLIALAMAVTAACIRRAPGVSLALLWVVCLLQVA